MQRPDGTPRNTARTCVVTGAAGFIGSHLCERLLGDGHRVLGLDAFVPYYPRAVKEANLAGLLGRPGFRFVEVDLRDGDLGPLVAGADWVFHLAAMPGLLASWSSFDLYMTCNLLATQRLLEAVKANPVGRFIQASTSSVYGAEAVGDETRPTRPVSPYGVTKLAAEFLVQTYRAAFGVPAVVLRFFSVYGPRQRPDMGYHIFIRALLADQVITVFGTGEAVRTNTYVADLVDGAVRAAAHARDGETYNLSGGEAISVNDVLALLGEIAGKTPRITRGPPRPGDQTITAADTSKARRDFGYEPRTTLREGLAAQARWQAAVRDAGVGAR